MTDPRKPVFDAIRAARGKGFTQPEVNQIDKLLDDLRLARASLAAKPKEPAWLVEARALIGQKEIPGPKHNRWIAEGWKRLGAGWFTDDETPWCGLFVAHCIEKAGLPFPKMFPRALAWAEWGKACPPAVGAIVVFKRSGGGHVGFLVGESAANYYVLGGNQSNAVNIMPLAKNRAVAIRWPVSLSLPAAGLPKMTGGVVSTNEA